MIMLRESLKKTGPISPDTETFESAESITSNQSTSFAAGSRVRTSRSPAKAKGLQEKGPVCGKNFIGSFASLDPDTSSWKTLRPSEVGDSQLYSRTWPRSGMMRNGIAYQLPPLVLLTKGIGSGLWPTPNVGGGGNPPSLLIPHQGHFIRRSGKKAHLSLDQAVKIWPTPLASDATKQGHGNLSHRVKLNSKGLLPTPVASDTGTNKHPYSQGGMALSDSIGGQLNPTWVEWLMGYPLGWTELDASVMPSSHKSSK